MLKVHIGQGEARTLEPQIVAANGREVINKVLCKQYPTDEGLLTHMKNNKTDCALAIFETSEPITMPGYIRDAIA